MSSGLIDLIYFYHCWFAWSTQQIVYTFPSFFKISFLTSLRGIIIFFGISWFYIHSNSSWVLDDI